MEKRGQVAMEYMLVVGFAMLMVIPLVAIYGTQGMESRDAINENQAYNIGRKIIDSAETVYYLGKPAKTTLKVYMPDNIESITVENNAVLFQIKTRKGIVDVPPAETSINLTGSLSPNPGIHYIVIAAEDYSVNVSMKS